MGGSWSNRVIERTVGVVAGQAAVLEHRIGVKVPPDARILCWLVQFAAYLMNRCDIGSAGKMAIHRLHGRGDNSPILELGKNNLYVPTKPARGKWDPRFLPEWLWAC